MMKKQPGFLTVVYNIMQKWSVDFLKWKINPMGNLYTNSAIIHWNYLKVINNSWERSKLCQKHVDNMRWKTCLAKEHQGELFSWYIVLGKSRMNVRHPFNESQLPRIYSLSVFLLPQSQYDDHQSYSYHRIKTLHVYPQSSKLFVF